MTEEQLAYGLPSSSLEERRLLYDSGTATLVLAFNTVDQGFTRSHVFVRRPDENGYSPILGEVAQDSLITPVLCESSALFTLHYKHVISSSSPIAYGHYCGVLRFDLSSHRHRRWDTTSGPTPCFVTELTGAQADGNVCFGIAGFRAKDNRGPVRYAMIRADWRNDTIEELFPLEAVFF